MFVHTQHHRIVVGGAAPNFVVNKAALPRDRALYPCSATGQRVRATGQH